MGYPSPSKCTAEMPARKPIRTLLDKMGGEVSRVYAGGKFTWMSTRLSVEELKVAIADRRAKKHPNSCNLTHPQTTKGHNNREEAANGTGAAIIDRGHNNNDGPQAGHDGAAEGPLRGHNNLASQVWLPKSGSSNLDRETVASLPSPFAALRDSLEGRTPAETPAPPPSPTYKPPNSESASAFAGSLFRGADHHGAEWFDLHGDDPRWTADDWRNDCARFVTTAMSRSRLTQQREALTT